MSAAASTPSPSRPRLLASMLVALVVGLVLGFPALLLANAGIGLIWVDPWASSQPPAWFVFVVLIVGAIAVYAVRRFVGDAGHSPIGGISVSALPPRAYAGVILAVLASLWGGMVLGPEVALVATGSMVGTVVANAMGCAGADRTKVIGVGALGAILVLFVGPLLAGSLEIGGAPTAIEVDQLAWAVPVAITAAVAVTIARLLAALLSRASGPRPHLPILVGAAIVIGVCALLFTAVTGESIMFIVTSGEEMITDLPAIASVSTAAAVLVFKTIAYAVSLGAGYRGGPFFPAMFVGASSGLLFALLLPSGPSVPAALVVGVIAGVIATAPMKWPVAILLGIVIGFAMGTWTLVPAAVLGAVVARAIPRVGDRVSRVQDHALAGQQSSH